MKKPDFIYLQQSDEGWSDEGVTWLRSRINNSDAKYISTDHVQEMIEALIEARKAILNADDDCFGESKMQLDGKVIPYPLKDELLNNIDKALKKAGCAE